MKFTIYAQPCDISKPIYRITREELKTKGISASKYKFWFDCSMGKNKKYSVLDIPYIEKIARNRDRVFNKNPKLNASYYCINNGSKHKIAFLIFGYNLNLDVVKKMWDEVV